MTKTAAAKTTTTKPTKTKTKTKTKPKPKPVAGLRATQRARHPQPPAQQQLLPEPDEAPAVAVPGMRTRAGGRVTRRMTIYLPPELAERVEREAFATRTTVSLLAQAAFEVRYAAQKASKAS